MIKILQTLIKGFRINLEIKKWLNGIDHEKISLGQNCNAAFYLKENNCKNASYPFDWIFSSGEIVLHAIKDDFTIFLDERNITDVNGNRAGHEFYHSYLFNHKSPLKKENRLYYKRCINRFRNILNSEKHIVFVCFVINEHKKRISWAKGFNREIKLPINQNIHDFKELISSISSIHNNSKFIFINQLTEGKIDLKFQFYKKNILWIDFVSKGENTGLKYINRVDHKIIKLIFNGLR